jgi:tetratricopeptide (TPR) repeat protein
MLAGCVAMSGNHYTTGQKLFLSKEYHKSLEELAQTPPSSPEYPKAQKYMQQAAKKICVADFYLRRAIVSSRKGNNGKALSQVNKALKVYPEYKPAIQIKRGIEKKLAASVVRKSHPNRKRYVSYTKSSVTSPKKGNKPNATEGKEAAPSETENYQGSKRLYYRGKHAYQNGEIKHWLY